MVALVKCKPCREGRHEDCERGASAPPGMIGGGWICTCGCRGASLDGTFQEKMKGITMTPKPKAEETLKACPCGSRNIKKRSSGRHYHWVQCDDCGNHTSSKATIDKAIQCWNRRTPAKDEGEERLQIGWYCSDSKRFCYTDEKEVRPEQRSNYDVPVYAIPTAPVKKKRNEKNTADTR